MRSHDNSSSRLFMSCICGSGIYEQVKSSSRLPMLRNVLTKETYLGKLLYCEDSQLEHYRRLILNPPQGVPIAWPADLLRIPGETSIECSAFVSQRCSDDFDGSAAAKHLLLFRAEDMPKLPSLQELLKGAEPAVMSWQNPEIRRLASGILSAILKLNRAGYIYADIQLSRFLADSSCSIFLDFSNLVYPLEQCADCSYTAGTYPLEFGDPAVVRRIKEAPDFQSQNISIASLLFYLFFGRLPYDGRLQLGYSDNGFMRHCSKFRFYHKLPVFIFDPEDSSNALGLFREELAVIELWSSCPEEIRTMFTETLKRENVERTQPVDTPTPSMWLSCLEAVGWCAKDKEELT